MWKALTYFVALPGVGVSMLNVFLKSRHAEHERPEFVAYPHLRIRTKVRPTPSPPFKRPLFHGPLPSPSPGALGSVLTASLSAQTETFYLLSKPVCKSRLSFLKGHTVKCL